MRADLHLHSYHSGRCGHLRFLRARDCYSEPERVYAAAKARGMDLVTITDHDSIGGCLEFLDRHPDADDFFISEEIECRFAECDLKVHVGAYGIDETIHREIQPLRSSVADVAAYLRSRGVFFALNHPLFFFRGQMPLADYLEAARVMFPGLEVRNGTMLAEHNLLVQALLDRWAAAGHRVTAVGGSDSHTLNGVGTTYTEAPGVNRHDFLQSLGAGLGRAGGKHGSAWREAREIYGVVGQYWKSLLGCGRPDLSVPRRTLGLAFSVVTMPFEFSPLLVAAAHKLRESRSIGKWRRACENGEASIVPTLPLGDPEILTDQHR